MRIFILMGLFFTSACGFSPLYRTNETKTTDLTAQIAIQPIANYDGYLMENYLNDGLNLSKINDTKTYVLSVSLNDPVISEQNIQNDNFSSRDRMTLTAEYSLKNIKTNEVVIKTTTSATSAYNIAIEPYATWSAQKKVQENLIKMLADRITLHVISFVQKKEVENEG
ncbi:MAG: hypothetical protein IKV03_04515 [Alphaproteobacteria bacterium]|nr:hypothetical protein [Alphaproteobacteria bacterium]